MSQPVELTVNGETRSVPTGTDIQGLVKFAKEKNIGLVLIDNLAKIGIKVKMVPLTWPNMVARGSKVETSPALMARRKRRKKKKRRMIRKKKRKKRRRKKRRKRRRPSSRKQTKKRFTRNVSMIARILNSTFPRKHFLESTLSFATSKHHSMHSPVAANGR